MYQNLDWQQQSERFQQLAVNYPPYYSTQNFHGIEGGYLNPIAAVTYDVVSSFACPPHETWVRQRLITAIQGHPKRILDLGCGTGTTTLMLKEAFEQATLIGLDLSPYMLVMADYKARQEGLDIDWKQGLAEKTGFEDSSFDLVTVSMLLHETPPHISQLILRECFRLLKPEGQLIILDGNQQRLRHADWLIKMFQEPYSKVYAAESVDDWLSLAGFRSIQTKPVGWIHQVTRGFKPVSSS